MTEPATGTLAATAALTASAGGVAIINTLNTIPMGEYVPGTIFAMLGALSWKFIAAQSAREKAAQAGTPRDKLPTVDLVAVGYALFGAPLASGAVIAIVHMFGGSANFLSVPGFLFAGATAPALVTRVVGMFMNMIPGNKETP